MLRAPPWLKGGHDGFDTSHKVFLSRLRRHLFKHVDEQTTGLSRDERKSTSWTARSILRSTLYARPSNLRLDERTLAQALLARQATRQVPLWAYSGLHCGITSWTWYCTGEKRCQMSE